MKSVSLSLRKISYVPLPKCNDNCYTLSNKEDSLKSCESQCKGTVRIPKCTFQCHTTSNDEDALLSCTENCGSKDNPVSVPLPNCVKNCHTTFKK